MTSNTTEHYNLPQYAINDHPDFLSEINEAYLKIDTVLYEIQATLTSTIERIESVTNRVESLENAIEE